MNKKDGVKLKVFVFFAGKNKASFLACKKHLSLLCDVLSQEDIPGGGVRAEAIGEMVTASKAVIVLGSADAFSKGLDGRALDLIGDSGKPCIPIMVELYGLYEFTRIAHIEPLCGGKPIKSDADWVEVAGKLRQLF